MNGRIAVFHRPEGTWEAFFVPFCWICMHLQPGRDLSAWGNGETKDEALCDLAVAALLVGHWRPAPYDIGACKYWGE